MEDGDGIVIGGDEPAELGTVLEGEEDFFDGARGALFGGVGGRERARDLGLRVRLSAGDGLRSDGWVGGEVEAVLDFAVVVGGDVAPLEDGDVGDEGAIGEGAAQFGEGVGARPFEAVNFGGEAASQGAVFALKHRFEADLPVDVFAGRFRFWEGQKFSEGIRLSGC